MWTTIEDRWFFYMGIEQNRPLRYIQDMSVFHPWCQGTVGPSHRRNAGSLDLVFLATKNVVRKRLATGCRIHPTSWLTLVKLESSSFRELDLKSDQSVVSGKQILAKKRKPTKLPDHQYSFNHLMFCEVRGFTITLEAFGEIMNYESPFQWSLPITRSSAV